MAGCSRLAGIAIRISRKVCLGLLLCGLAGASEEIHFLIPAGSGGGWDATARSVGDALTRSGIIEVASFENMSGGGGSRAMAHLIETAGRQGDTLMVSSTPIIVNAVRKLVPQSYHDLTPIASVIADYGAFVVKANSKYHAWADVLADYMADPRRVKVAGGSNRGSTDHLVAALAFKQSGGRAADVRYIPYNGGGHAMIGLLSEETQLLSTGVGEAIVLARQGEVRILAVSARERLEFLPDVPTLTEQGAPVEFANWRGFFAAPGVSEERQKKFHELLGKMTATPEWQQIKADRGWVGLFAVGEDFENFLATQETVVAGLIKDLNLAAGRQR